MLNSKLFYRTTFGDHEAQAANFKQSHWIPSDPSVTTVVPTTEIVVQIEADEGTHLALESHPNFHAMSLLVSGSTLCAACVAALAAYGITAADNMWNCGKKLGQIHPGMKPSRF